MKKNNPRLTLTRQDVRRLAIARQHLADDVPQPMLDVIRDLGCLQLDPIRAVERTHLLVLWSRLGNFDRADLARLRWRERALFEYMAHAASLVLTEEYPVHFWRMAQKRQYPLGERGFGQDTAVAQALRTHILQRLTEEGPLFARDFESKAGINRDSRWSNGRFVNRLLHILWQQGIVMVVGREGLHRRWGLAEAFLPDWTPREMWDDEAVCRFAAQKAVRALGAASAKQIRQHYTRGRYPHLPKVLKALVKEGVLVEADVHGPDGLLPGPYFVHRDDLALLAKLQDGAWSPRTTLLSPFDNLICDRDRTEVLFDFYFRIEIYVPKAKREFGYYVLPVLHGDRLIGRVDSKMDRKAGKLHIFNVYAEDGAPDGVAVVTAVADAITSLARFLGAKEIVWGNVPAMWRGIQS